MQLIIQSLSDQTHVVPGKSKTRLKQQTRESSVDIYNNFYS